MSGRMDDKSWNDQATDLLNKCMFVRRRQRNVCKNACVCVCVSECLRTSDSYLTSVSIFIRCACLHMCLRVYVCVRVLALLVPIQVRTELWPVVHWACLSSGVTWRPSGPRSPRAVTLSPCQSQGFHTRLSALEHHTRKHAHTGASLNKTKTPEYNEHCRNGKITIDNNNHIIITNVIIF